jgi:hypothetical protein
MENEACLHRKREPDIPHDAPLDEKLAIESAFRSRLIAAGRLFDIHNLTQCFKTKQEAVVVLAKHRARCRALWNGENMPDCHTDPSDDAHRAENAIRKLQDKADRLLCAPNQATRQDDADFASQWTEELRSAMSCTQEHVSITEGSIQQQRLQSIWEKAAFPTKKCLTGGIPDPKHLAALLKKPLVLNDAHDWYASSTFENANGRDASLTLDIPDIDPFAEITDVVYEYAASEHTRLGLPRANAPLNPEQRASGRHVLKVAPSTTLPPPNTTSPSSHHTPATSP